MVFSFSLQISHGSCGINIDWNRQNARYNDNAVVWHLIYEFLRLMFSSLDVIRVRDRFVLLCNSCVPYFKPPTIRQYEILKFSHHLIWIPYADAMQIQLLKTFTIEYKRDRENVSQEKLTTFQFTNEHWLYCCHSFNLFVIYCEMRQATMVNKTYLNYNSEIVRVQSLKAIFFMNSVQPYWFVEMSSLTRSIDYIRWNNVRWVASSSFYIHRENSGCEFE